MKYKTTRREILLGLAATGALPLTAFADTGREPAFVSCCRLEDGSYAAGVLDAHARLLFTENLDARGHDAAVSHDGGTAVVFARRPGRFALVLDLRQRRRVQAFSTPQDRHFQGHGFFTRDGRLLLATENDFDGERGVIGIYDTGANYARIGEFDSGGIGPHEALLLRDGRTIAVANGGILTHPDFPRQKLNLPEMAPSITYIDIATGDRLEQVSLKPELHQLSIRHMAEDARGRIWFGGQFEGGARPGVPLAGWHERGRDITLCEAPDAIWFAMKHYVGSVAADASGSRIAMTSPRGGTMVLWDAERGSILEQRNMADVCGIAPAGTDFLASTGAGQVALGTSGAEYSTEEAWDNHIATIAHS